MAHFLQAHGETVSEVERAELLAAHATSLRRHVEGLAAKAYWTAFTRSPRSSSASCRARRSSRRRSPTTPASTSTPLAQGRARLPGTLFAVLRTIGAIWQQDALEQNARELLVIGQDLYARLTTLGGTSRRWASRCPARVEQYNKFVGTLESRVLVTARRMHELHLTTRAAAEPRAARGGAPVGQRGRADRRPRPRRPATRPGSSTSRAVERPEAKPTRPPPEQQGRTPAGHDRRPGPGSSVERAGVLEGGVVTHGAGGLALRALRSRRSSFGSEKSSDSSAATTASTSP